MQRLRQRRTGGLQLFPMQDREAPQQLFPAASQFDQHLTAIFLAMAAYDCAAIHQPVDQFHGAVMAQAEPHRKSADGRPDSGRQTFYRE